MTGGFKFQLLPRMEDGVKFVPALNAFMNIWCTEEAILMGINRNVDELAFFKLTF